MLGTSSQPPCAQFLCSVLIPFFPHLSLYSWTKLGPHPVSVNKVLSEHSHTIHLQVICDCLCLRSGKRDGTGHKWENIYYLANASGRLSGQQRGESSSKIAPGYRSTLKRGTPGKGGTAIFQSVLKFRASGHTWPQSLF